jgi:uncharacterized membrane protein
MVFASMNKIPWIAFALALLFAIFYFSNTVSSLPPMVASHFDGAGFPTTFMTRALYSKFVFALGVGFPLAIVALLSVVYSKAGDMKLPNRDYWLAPERIAQTRALLVSHAVWFGCLIVAMICYMHWLIMAAHHSVPLRLSNQMVMGGVLVFMGIAIGWLIGLLRTLRRPRVIT